MIFEEPRYLLAGDRYILIELGNELCLDINIKALSLAEKIKQNKTKGVIETVPSFATLLIHYEPEVIKSNVLIALCEELLGQLGSVEEMEIPSRLIEIPVNYNDRWTRECFEDYCKTIKRVEHNPDLIARVNGLRGIPELTKYHSTPQWWVGAVGFLAGLPTLMSLDPRYFLTAPKYDPPRLWTPVGTVALGGGFTTIFPMVTPDGYQLLGRTPLPIYDNQQRLRPFKDSFFLLRTGDRVKFVPISEAEFLEIEKEVKAGIYHYNIIDYEIFSVRKYKEFCEQAKKEIVERQKIQLEVEEKPKAEMEEEVDQKAWRWRQGKNLKIRAK
jgi:urea carboxylase